MQEKIQQKNLIHKKLLFILWTVGLVLGLAVGCGKNNDNKINLAPEIDTQEQKESVDSRQEEQKTARIHFIDTGNSDAILIEQGDVAALIDGGDNNDEQLVVDYINNLGIEKLDYVFATHPDADHIGGLDAVLTNLEVGQVLVGNGKVETKTYTDMIQAIMDKGLTPSVPLLGSSFSLGDAALTIVSVANEKDVNNCSLVILYTYGETRVIFMGDADQSIESKIDMSLVGDVDLIKVGHHGSKTSSNEAFIKAIHPEYAVITCGEGNKYNHPDQITLDTLSQLDIAIYRTDQLGDIVFEVTEKSINPLQGAVHTNNGSSVGEGEKNSSQALGQNTSQNTHQSVSSSTEKAETDQAEDEVVEAFKPIEAHEGTIVYYTNSGKCFHMNQTCSNMKEPIATTMDEVGERTPCKKCCH